MTPLLTLNPRLRIPLYALLTAATLLIHGYHPFAEDGGLYVAGIQSLLDPGLFPHYTAFATEHLRFSLFAPSVALFLRATHLSLESGLLLIYLLSTFLLFAAAGRLLRQLVSPAAPLGGLLLLCAWWTLPVAGTSLFLQDPYLTARSLATPLCLYALALALELHASSPAQTLTARTRRLLASLLLFTTAAALHPADVRLCPWPAPLRLRRTLRPLAALVRSPRRRRARLGHPAATALASREPRLPRRRHQPLLLVPFPLAVVRTPRPRRPAAPSPSTKPLVRFLPELRRPRPLPRLPYLRSHLPAGQHGFRARGLPRPHRRRLQPLRSFVWIYLVMVLLLGSVAFAWWQRLLKRRVWSPAWLAAPCAVVAVLASVMFSVQRAEFHHSNHLELPTRLDRSRNPWMQAFRWAHLHTPKDALFAMDAHYITHPGEDAQTFRASAERSILPDYSKDGGEASITPSLADSWFRGQAAQTDLNTLTDAQRDARLRPFGVDWLILDTSTPTVHPCPYANLTVKVCRLAR